MSAEVIHSPYDRTVFKAHCVECWDGTYDSPPLGYGITAKEAWADAQRHNRAMHAEEVTA